jgi:hypothetical protein
MNVLYCETFGSGWEAEAGCPQTARVPFSAQASTQVNMDTESLMWG